MSSVPSFSSWVTVITQEVHDAEVARIRSLQSRNSAFSSIIGVTTRSSSRLAADVDATFEAESNPSTKNRKRSETKPDGSTWYSRISRSEKDAKVAQNRLDKKTLRSIKRREQFTPGTSVYTRSSLVCDLENFVRPGFKNHQREKEYGTILKQSELSSKHFLVRFHNKKKDLYCSETVIFPGEDPSPASTILDRDASNNMIVKKLSLELKDDHEEIIKSLLYDKIVSGPSNYDETASYAKIVSKYQHVYPWLNVDMLSTYVSEYKNHINFNINSDDTANESETVPPADSVAKWSSKSTNHDSSNCNTATNNSDGVVSSCAKPLCKPSTNITNNDGNDSDSDSSLASLKSFFEKKRKSSKKRIKSSSAALSKKYYGFSSSSSSEDDCSVGSNDSNDISKLTVLNPKPPTRKHAARCTDKHLSPCSKKPNQLSENTKPTNGGIILDDWLSVNMNQRPFSKC